MIPGFSARGYSTGQATSDFKSSWRSRGWGAFHPSAALASNVRLAPFPRGRSGCADQEASAQAQTAPVRRHFLRKRAFGSKLRAPSDSGNRLFPSLGFARQQRIGFDREVICVRRVEIDRLNDLAGQLFHGEDGLGAPLRHHAVR